MAVPATTARCVNFETSRSCCKQPPLRRVMIFFARGVIRCRIQLSPALSCVPMIVDGVTMSTRLAGNLLTTTTVVAALSVLFWAGCDGQTTNPQPHPAIPDDTTFDDYFTPHSRATDANEPTATPPPCAKGSCADGDGAEFMDGAGGQATDQPATIVCDYALVTQVPACSAFCGAVQRCTLGDAQSASDCDGDCAHSMGGADLEQAAELLACFSGAGCDALAAWSGRDIEGEDTPPSVPTDSGAPDGDGGVQTYENAIEGCLDKLFLHWQSTPLQGAKAELCAATQDAPHGGCGPIAHLMTPQAVARFASCNSDTGETGRDACFTRELMCAPFVATVATWLDEGDTLTVEDAVTDPAMP